MKFKFLNFGKNKVHVRLHEADFYFKYDSHLLQLQVTGFKCKFVHLGEYNFETKIPIIWENGEIIDIINKSRTDINSDYISTFLKCFTCANKEDIIRNLSNYVSRLSFNKLKNWLIAVEILMMETTKFSKRQLHELTNLVENKPKSLNLDNWEPESKLTDEEFERIKFELFGNVKI